ncbi:chemotaxis protein CheW [Propionivibrio limicola]|uniref:chemotaxis protein CheW n=1 Tax=Propionivibrio limicola TaxID=167645 RepID=UPI001291A93F|nr:chemotaxis protein CheW [Propionivibrio limicola]
MARYKNIELDARLAGVIRCMNTVEEYREVLQGLQTVWDNLTLLGQMSGTGTDMSSTRQAFNQLTGNLLNQLGAETLNKCVQEMAAKAQVAIDILVRNLFERTADIGFLATDEDVCRFIGLCNEKAADPSAGIDLDAERECLRARFAEYVAKYSVYFDIVLLDTSGSVLGRLDSRVDVSRTNHSLLAESLETTASYVESFGKIDLLPDCERALIYSYRVTNGDGKPTGVLCLCFRFENEMARIFGNLSAPDDWSVIALLDANGTVIASSDAFHIPVGARLDPVLGDEYRVVRFAGREYLATSCATQGYQGYLGPGWVGHVMLPVQHAFNKDSSEMLKEIDAALLRMVMDSPSLFGDELRNIPLQANRIQRDLNRSVWNGNVHQSSSRRALNPSFSKILLWEISNTGSRTKDVFARSIANLHETVVSSILQDSRFLASLAVDIMDRNLYERANDCRWWALTSDFRDLLASNDRSASALERMTSILQTINSLYTVYSNLIVFDSQGRVVAVSQPDESGLVGKVIQEEWVRNVLTLPDSQGYAVSSFSATPLYRNRHTYVYGAAISAPGENRIVGGVGIVFDSEPQFVAMLRDALPRNEAGEVTKGAFAAFVEGNGRIIATTDPERKPGDRLPLEASFFSLAKGEGRAGIVQLGNSCYAVGARMSSGYREYKGEGDAYVNDVLALIFVPLCQSVEARSSAEIKPPVVRSDRAVDSETVEIATFLVGNKWFGLRSSQIAEAVDFGGMTGVPGAGSDFAGYLMYGGVPIPVFDIRRIVDAGPPCSGVDSQVVVLKKGENSHFGILVDGLGEIPEVCASRLQALPDLLAGGNLLADSIVMTDVPEKETLLVVLGVDRIAARLVPTIPDKTQGEGAMLASRSALRGAEHCLSETALAL